MKDTLSFAGKLCMFTLILIAIEHGATNGGCEDYAGYTVMGWIAQVCAIVLVIVLAAVNWLDTDK
jgi:hypothetical protein